MNLKSVRLPHNSQRQLSQQKVSSSLHNSTLNESKNNDMTVNELHNAATNSFLIMLESEVRKYWGV